MTKGRKKEYTQSPWSGQAYKSAPTIDELTKESISVLQKHPTAAKAMGLAAMDKFIEQYKAQHGIS